MNRSGKLGTDLASFWTYVHKQKPDLPAGCPEAWTFGATKEHADELLAHVVDGIKTGTASALWDIEDGGEPVPEAGDLSIILDGRARPQAVIETTAVDVVPFGEVTAEHAHAEGEGDRSLAAWREIHEKFWRDFGSRGFAADMPVVCERFRLICSVDGAHTGDDDSCGPLMRFN